MDNILLYEPGLIASGNLSNYQYYCVKYGSVAGDVALSADTADACGTVQNNPKDNGVANVPLIGIGKAKIGSGGVSKGSRLVSDSAYKAAATTTNTDKYFGIALAAADTNDIIPYLAHNGMYAG